MKRLDQLIKSNNPFVGIGAILGLAVFGVVTGIVAIVGLVATGLGTAVVAAGYFVFRA